MVGTADTNTCPICDLCTQIKVILNEESDIALITILAHEIHLDGGVSFLNKIKSHESSFLISHLLKTSSPSIKLAPFLKKYPSLFDVRRDTHEDNVIKSRHTVSLRCDILESCKTCEARRREYVLKRRFHFSIAYDLKTTQNVAAKKLEERVYFFLKQRLVKLKRRTCRKLTQHEIGSKSTEINKFAKVDWIARKLENEIHKYVRLLHRDKRPKGELVGSVQWWTLVVPIFLDFLEVYAGANIEFRADKKEVALRVHLCTDLDRGKLEDYTISKKIMIDSYLVSILSAKNAPRVNGIDYGLLLQRHESLRNLLDGQDLIEMIQSEQKDANSRIFENVTLIRHNDHKVKETNANAYNWRIALRDSKDHVAILNLMESKLGSKNSNKLKTENDNVGLFSITGSKTASSMAKSLVNALKNLKKMIGGNHDDDDNICIDLTAGLGGNVIACSKHFSKVIGLEIDEERASLCQKNVVEQIGVDTLEDSNVTIMCENSLEMLPKLAISYGRCPVSVMLDPPWGGLDYRKYSDEVDHNLGLASANGANQISLSRVVGHIAEYLSPAILGIKLPLTFGVETFLIHLKNTETHANKVKVLSIRKMKRQLFLLLCLP